MKIDHLYIEIVPPLLGTLSLPILILILPGYTTSLMENFEHLTFYKIQEHREHLEKKSTGKDLLLQNDSVILG